MLIADDDGVPLRERSRDHGMVVHQSGDLDRQLGVTVLTLPDPGCRIGRQPKTGMVGRRDLRDDAVDGADLDARPGARRAVREHGTGGMGMGQD